MNWQRLLSGAQAFLQESLTATGLLWLITEVVAFFTKEAGNRLSEQGWWFLGAAVAYGVVRAIVVTRQIRSYSFRLRGRDTSIGFRVANALDLSGALVVPTNCTFDTDLESRLVAASSVQGAFTRRVYASKVRHLDTELDAALDGLPFEQLANGTKPGKLRCYDVGTVAHLEDQGRNFYLVAVTAINSSGRAAGRDSDLDAVLAKLWYDIGDRGDKTEIVIPLIGTGYGRMTFTRAEVARRIVSSFIAACAEKNFCEKLTIAVYPGDFKKRRIDLNDLARFIEFKCTYTEFSSGSEPSLGTAA